jgi:hypothetical protein
MIQNAHIPKPRPAPHPQGCMCVSCQQQRTLTANQAPQQGEQQPPEEFRYQSMQPWAQPPVHGNIYDAGVVIPDGGLHGRINTTGISQGAKAMEEI